MFFSLGIPSQSLALPRNFLKFSLYLCPTRVNFCAANSNTFPGQVEGAANFRESSRTLAPSLFPFWCFLFGRAISVFSERFFNRLRPKKKRRGDGGCHRENPRETRYKLPPLLPPTNDSKREKARTQEKMRTRALQIRLAVQLTASGLRPHSAARKTAQSELYE